MRTEHHRVARKQLGAADRRCLRSAQDPSERAAAYLLQLERDPLTVSNLLTPTGADRIEPAHPERSCFFARSGDIGREAFGLSPLSLMPIENLTPAMEDRAFEVRMLLADRGQHRAPSIPDLLVAATAEKAGLTVLAVDKAFDLIAEVTGQSIEALALV